MVFLKTNNNGEYKKYFLFAFEHMQELYGEDNVHFGLEKILDEEEIVFYFVKNFDELCKGPSKLLAKTTFGLSKDREVYIKKSVLEPNKLISEEFQLKYLDRLITEEDIKHVVKVIATHEFQETVLGNHEDFYGSIPHILLSHFDEIPCIDNYTLIESDELTYLQRKYLSDINRDENPCERHLKLVKDCLTNH